MILSEGFHRQALNPIPCERSLSGSRPIGFVRSAWDALCGVRVQGRGLAVEFGI